MRIPIFISCPSELTTEQLLSKDFILGELDSLGLEPRVLGRSDYAIDFPLREVLLLARRCAGGLILGYTQVTAPLAISKPGTRSERTLENLRIPTPWNQLEAGVLFAIGVPLVIFCEPGVSGGVFDLGSTDLFIQRMPRPGLLSSERELREVLRKWNGRVREHYDRS